MERSKQYYIEKKWHIFFYDIYNETKEGAKLKKIDKNKLVLYILLVQFSNKLSW